MGEEGGSAALPPWWGSSASAAAAVVDVTAESSLPEGSAGAAGLGLSSAGAVRPSTPSCPVLVRSTVLSVSSAWARAVRAQQSQSQPQSQPLPNAQPQPQCQSQPQPQSQPPHSHAADESRQREDGPSTPGRNRPHSWLCAATSSPLPPLHLSRPRLPASHVTVRLTVAHRWPARAGKGNVHSVLLPLVQPLPCSPSSPFSRSSLLVVLRRSASSAISCVCAFPSYV